MRRSQPPLVISRTQCWVERGSHHRFPTSHWYMWLFLWFSESDSDLEPVGTGIQHLQKLSQELDEAIVAEER